MKTTQERLQKCFEHLRYIGEVRTQNDLAKRIGVGKSNVSSAMNGNTAYLTDNFLMRFCQAFPIFDLRWLTTGEGEMLKSAPVPATEAEEEYSVFLLPTEARGGSLQGFSEAVQRYACEKIVSPVKDADFAIRVSGESMSPEYPSGSIIFIKKINTSLFIEWGKVFVLDTENGVILKRVMPHEDESKMWCVSYNPDFPRFEVCKNDIIGMYRVLALLTEK